MAIKQVVVLDDNDKIPVDELPEHPISSHDTIATGEQLDELVSGGQTTLHSHAGGGGLAQHGNEYHTPDFAEATHNHDTDYAQIDHNHNEFIPKSTGTAKGDLIVYTSSGNPTRLGSGSNGQVLTVNTSEQTGLAWTTPSGGGGSGDYTILRFLRPGAYHLGYLVAGAATTQTLTANRLYAVPFYIGKAVTVTRIAIQVTTAATGNARLGIYADNGATCPGTLVSDCGEVNTGSTGLKEITGLSVNLTANVLYWLALVSNGTATISATAIGSLLPLLGLTTGLNLSPYASYYVSYTYGSLPETFPSSPTMGNGNAPRIGVYI